MTVTRPLVTDLIIIDEVGYPPFEQDTPGKVAATWADAGWQTEAIRSNRQWSETTSIEEDGPWVAEPHGWGISMSVNGEFQ